MKLNRRILTIILCLSLVIGLVPDMRAMFQASAVTSNITIVQNGGTGATGPSTANDGDAITINAGTPPSGKVFDSWSVLKPSTLVTSSLTSTALSFVMPAEAVTVAINWKDPVTSSTPDTPPVINKDVKPEFDIVGDPVFGDFTTSGEQHLTIKIKNVSSHFASSVMATLEMPEGSKEESPFQITGAKMRNDAKNIGQGKTTDLNFSFYINPKAVTKNYKLNLNIKCKNVYGNEYKMDIPLYIKVFNNVVEPIIYVMNHTVEGEMANSTTPTQLRIKIKNDAKNPLTSISTQLLDLSADGILLYNDNDLRRLPEMAANTDIVLAYNIIASKGATSAKSLKLKIKYYDRDGQVYEKEFPLYIPVKTDNAVSKDIKVEFSQKSYQLSAGSSMEVNVKVSNNGSSDAKNLKLNLSADGGLKFLSPYITQIEKLAPQEVAEYTYTIYAGEEMAKGSLPISASLSSMNDKEGTLAAISAVNIDKTMDKKSKPKIIIASYNYGGEYVMAGKEFEVTVDFLNTSSAMGIKNCKVQFDSQDGIFVPVNSTNSFFFKDIAPMGTVSKTLKFKTKSDAKVQFYAITFKMEYEDATGKAYDENKQLLTSEERATINVKQEIRLDAGDVKLPPSVMSESNIPIECEFFNLGKSPLYNMMVKVEGDFDKQDAAYYVGNFDAGKSDLFRPTIIVHSAGEHKGKIIFSFEDETGEKLEVSKEFTFKAEDGNMGMNGEGGIGPDGKPLGMGPDGKPFPQDGYEDPQSQSKLPLYIGIAGVIIAVVVGAVVLKKRKQKKLQALLEEDKDED